MHKPNPSAPQGGWQFEVGMHVVCVEDRFVNSPDVKTGLIKGKIYTIEHMWYANAMSNTPATLVIHVAEAMSPDLSLFGGYVAPRFRPLPKLKIEDFGIAQAPVPVRRVVEAQ